MMSAVPAVQCRGCCPCCGHAASSEQIPAWQTSLLLLSRAWARLPAGSHYTGLVLMTVLKHHPSACCDPVSRIKLGRTVSVLVIVFLFLTRA